MARNGTGTYALPNTVNPVVTDTTITSTWANTTLDDIATELTNSLPRDGQAAPTANLPMGGYKLTGLGNGSASTDSVNYGQVFTSPAFTGTPTAPTAAVGTNTTQIATMAALQAAAFAATLPSQTGNSGKSIVTDGSTASWGVSGVTGGGTGQSSYTVGDILYASGATTLSKLAASTAGYVLTSGGPGVAPSWAEGLPSQTGNSGKFLTTNGTDASWAVSGIGSVASVTDSTTLTASSAGYQSGAMTAIGKAFTLPDATTMTVGGPRFILKNDGGYPFGIRNSAGTLVGAVAAGGIAYVTLKDNGSASGSWSVIGDNLEPGLITIDNTFSSTYASTVLKPFVALDDNKSIHFVAIAAGGFAAVAVDKTTGAVGTPVTVSAASSPDAVFKVSPTSAIVFYDKRSAVVVSLSGATTLSVGTAANAASNIFPAEDFSGAPTIAQLSSTLYVASGTLAPNTFAVAISVSGTTVTIGSAANIITANMVSNSTTTYALTATTALVLYKSGAGAPYQGSAVVISVSGTTCTVGTPANTLTSSSTGVSSSCLLSSTKALVVDDGNTSGTVSIVAATISGASVTAGGAVSVESSVTTPFYTTNAATRFTPHLFLLSATTALLWYLDGSGVSRSVVLTESGGAVTSGAILYNSISSAGVNTTAGGSILPQGTAEFVSVMKTSVGAAGDASAVSVTPHKISGTSITAGHSVLMDKLGTPTATNTVIATRLSSGDYCLFPQINGGEMQVFRSNGDRLAYKGSLGIPIIVTAPAYPVHGVSSNRLVFLMASRSTTVGTGTYQLRLLSIEVCA